MSSSGPLTDDGLVQLLTPTGERVDHPDYASRVSHLDGEALRGLYRDMVIVRRFDTEATALQRQGELGLWAQSLGQE
ncbi:MAG TPA: pyruvate dehydrogenase (acetyl-transferring) E1 component subunit alpha, partial [Cellulomonas sp.]